MGRKGANHTAIFFAAVGTIACGLSRNMEQLVAARFVRYYFGTVLSPAYLFPDRRDWRKWPFHDVQVRELNFLFVA
jgi:hypothetical protein